MKAREKKSEGKKEKKAHTLFPIWDLVLPILFFRRGSLVKAERSFLILKPHPSFCWTSMYYLDKAEQKAFTVECKFAVVMATNLGCLHLEVSRPACSSQLSASRAAFSGAAALRTGRRGALKSPTREAAAYFGTADSSYQGSCQIETHSDLNDCKELVSRMVLQSPPQEGLQQRVCLCSALPANPSGHREQGHLSPRLATSTCSRPGRLASCQSSPWATSTESFSSPLRYMQWLVPAVACPSDVCHLAHWPGKVAPWHVPCAGVVEN